MQVNMHEAKTQLSRLGKLAWEGEEIVIARNGEPYLRLTPYERPPRVPGLWKGKGWVADDFDDTPQDVIDSFYHSDTDEELLGTGAATGSARRRGRYAMRRLLIDSHVLLWWLFETTPLTGEASDLIGDRSNTVFVSAVTVWEIAIKATKGKLHAPESLEEAVLSAGFSPLAVTLGHGERAGRLPRFHNDPFDRLLVAQAQIEHLELVTRDRNLGAYGVGVVAA